MKRFRCTACGNECILETNNDIEPFMCPWTSCDFIEPTNWEEVI